MTVDMQASLFEEPGVVPDPSVPGAPVPDTSAQWRLSRVDLFNWGTFSGEHSFHVPEKGLVITGDSGSGKSSILDAIATVLTPRQKLRYNAAAQDSSARSQDRSLMNYVRGAWRRTDALDTDEIVSDHLRRGATWSGILLRYDTAASRSGASAPVVLVALCKVNAGQAGSGDATPRFLFLREDTTLEAFVPFLESAFDTRGIKKAFPEAFVTSTQSAFLGRVWRTMGLGSEGALLLLHRTMAAKNLGTLDALFRDYMLDPPRTFDLADTAVAQFDELSGAHREVVNARRQLEQLDRALDSAEAWVAARDRVASAQEQLAAVDPVTNEWILELVAKEIDDKRREFDLAEERLRTSLADVSAAEDALEVARALVQEKGGAAIGAIREQVEHARKDVDSVEKARETTGRHLARAGISRVPDSQTEFRELLRTLEDSEVLAAEERRVTERENANAELIGTRVTVLNEVTADLESARASRSNVDRGLLEARTRVADATGLSPAELPFAAELLQVRTGFEDWTGAIERVLRPLSTMMLVDAAHIDRVVRALEGMNVGTRLVYQSVGADVPSPVSVGQDSLVHRVEVKRGSRFAAWLNHRLAERFDYTCVESADALVTTAQGLTRAGQVKHRGSRFEKDDRWRVDDRTRWILGFDATERITSLMERRAVAERDLRAAEHERDGIRKERGRLDARRHVAEDLRASGWDRLDRAAAVEAHRQLRERLTELTDRNPDLAAAQKGFESRKEELARVRSVAEEERGEKARLEARLNELEAARKQAREELLGTDHIVEDEVRTEIRERMEGLSATRRVRSEDLLKLSKQVATELHEEENAAEKAASAAVVQYERVIRTFIADWPAVAVDLGPDIADHPAYRLIAERLRADALPQHEQRFLEMLRDQSMKNIGNLHMTIRRAPVEIRQGVEPVNGSLRRSYFDRGRYLQIRVKSRASKDLSEFLRDLETINSGGLGQTPTLEQADEKFAVMERVIGRLRATEPVDKRWRDTVLDTRKHVSFIAEEVTESGDVVNVHDSSDGLSGGQRQKLVIFCLAAALRFRLAAEEADVPSYGTVILDEAFDKADQTFTRMAMDIFTAFGFHMILVTPKKLLQTLEDYVGGIVLVENPNRNDSFVKVAEWEDIEDA